MTSRSAVAVSLVFALAACGSSNQPSVQPSATEAAPPDAASAAPEALPPSAAPSETPSAAASAMPSPTPTPNATPSAKASTSAMQAASATDAPASPPQAFNQCAACHSTTPGKTIIGPSLAGVYGTKAGEAPGFPFSDAMKNSGLVWNSVNLDKFLADPKAVVPGTLMGFAGLKDASQRKAVIDYLKTLK